MGRLILMGLFRLNLIGLLLISVVEASAGIAFIVDTTENDTVGRGNLEWDLAYVIEDIQETHPESRIVIVREETASSIRRKLALELLRSKESVDYLYIKSHGNRLAITNNSSTIELFLGSKEDVRSAFEPLVGNWSSFPTVIFGSCSLMDGQSKLTALTHFEDFADYMGISFGSIYMNRTEGLLASRLYYGQPIYAKSPWRVTITRIGSQIGGLVALPVSIYHDNVSKNLGYRFRRTPRGSEVHYDNYFNAMLSPLSMEERLNRGESNFHIILERIQRRLVGE